MTKEEYNSLADYQREMYDKCNRGNKGALFVGWAIGGICAAIFIVMAIAGAINPNSSGNILDVFQAIMGGVLFGGFIPGFAHLGFLFKKIKPDTAILLIILIGAFILMVYGIILMLIMFTGWIFLIVDTILFIMKKPLIYKLEDARILAKAEKQAGAYINRQ